ncbi:MAG: LysE family transporter [Planctomycetota bacterium]
MAELIAFLGKAVVISLSGVMAPGAMTAATLAAAPRNRHAGAIIAIGHAAIELPLMILIVAGFSNRLEHAGVKISVGLGGGLVLLLMAAAMLRNAAAPARLNARPSRHGPLLTGIILTVGNPLVLLWWAGAGLGLAAQAAKLGIMAFVLFAATHWSLDLIWLEVLTLTAHKGSKLLGGRAQRILLVLCAAAMIYFGTQFIWTGASVLSG